MAKKRKIEDVVEELELEQTSINDEETSPEIEESTCEKTEDCVCVEDEKNNALEKENQQLKDQYARLLADFDNFKRRSAQEGLNASTRGRIDVFKQLLEVIDNFDRALTYDAGTKEFKDGIGMVHKQMIERLTNLGLEEVETDGLMDPNYHQAVLVDKVDELEDDEIIEVLQKGYIVEEMLVRPAMVKVNKK
ncbi:MAG: nucleotide exchange factor GrpE [Mycoplasmatales bacterium]